LLWPDVEKTRQPFERNYSMRYSRSRGCAGLVPVLAAILSTIAVSAKADTFNLSPITIDTHALSGSSGYLLFSYGPDTTGTTPVNSTVSVSSSSFTTFNIDNSGASNYELEPFTFGNSFTFTPTFTTTSTPGADSGNLFTLFALDGTYNPYRTSDPTGGNAAAMIVQYSDGHGSAPPTYSFAPVPEASTFASFAVVAVCGAFGLAFRRRRMA
jgi:hypothetical protein